jgi:hypothetical protein
MVIAREKSGKPGRRRGSRDDETTRFFQRLVLPAPTSLPPMAPLPGPEVDPFLLAPSPWPKGTFRIDPEA